LDRLHSSQIDHLRVNAASSPDLSGYAFGIRIAAGSYAISGCSAGGCYLVTNYCVGRRLAASRTAIGGAFRSIFVEGILRFIHADLRASGVVILNGPSCPFFKQSMI
jgi:hypothetical protein